MPRLFRCICIYCFHDYNLFTRRQVRGHFFICTFMDLELERENDVAEFLVCSAVHFVPPWSQAMRAVMLLLAPEATYLAIRTR